MKPPHLLLPFLAVLTALFNAPLSAQETAPPAPEVEREDPTPAAKPAVSEENKKAAPDRARPAKPAPAERPASFIGVLTTHVSPELRSQLGIAEGFGLQVVEVMPESPAKEAGLQVHDILVKFGDQQLVNMEQLQALVRARTKGDEVPLVVISGGRESTVTVRIGERMMPVLDRQEEPRRPTGRFFQPNPAAPGGRVPPGPPMQNLQESVERFQNRLREYQERLQQWSREGHRGPMPNPPVFENFPHTDRGHRLGLHRDEERHESTSHHGAGVTRRDESGTYSLQRHGERSTFSVRPHSGSEQSWTFSNETQRSMIPEQYHGKLRMLEEVAEDMRRGDRDREGGRKAPMRTGEGADRPRGPGSEREGESKPRPPNRDTL